MILIRFLNKILIVPLCRMEIFFDEIKISTYEIYKLEIKIVPDMYYLFRSTIKSYYAKYSHHNQKARQLTDKKVYFTKKNKIYFELDHFNFLPPMPFYMIKKYIHSHCSKYSNLKILSFKKFQKHIICIKHVMF